MTCLTDFEEYTKFMFVPPYAHRLVFLRPKNVCQFTNSAHPGEVSFNHRQMERRTDRALPSQLRQEPQL